LRFFPLDQLNHVSRRSPLRLGLGTTSGWSNPSTAPGSACKDPMRAAPRGRCDRRGAVPHPSAPRGRAEHRSGEAEFGPLNPDVLVPLSEIEYTQILRAGIRAVGHPDALLAVGKKLAA